MIPLLPLFGRQRICATSSKRSLRANSGTASWSVKASNWPSWWDTPLPLPSWEGYLVSSNDGWQSFREAVNSLIRQQPESAAVIASPDHSQV